MAADYSVEIELPSMRTGDTFEELTGTLTSTDVGNLTNVELTTGTPYKLTVAAGDIEITDASTRTFKINKFVMNWPAGDYFVQWRFTFDAAIDDVITAYYTRLPITE